MYVCMFIHSSNRIIIRINIGDSNHGYASMITYIMFFISMNIGAFAYIISVGVHTGTYNIWNYARLYINAPFLAIFNLSFFPRRSSCSSRYFRKTILVWMASMSYFLVSIGLLTSIISIYYHLKLIKLLMNGRNQRITP